MVTPRTETSRPAGPSSPGPRGGLAAHAYAQLRQQLVTLQIPPGAPLVEEAVMADLGLGRTPVREAIQRLAWENLVVVYPRRGTFATDVKMTDLALISDVRAPLEGHAARRAAQRLTRTDRPELTGLRAELTDHRRHREDGAAQELQLDEAVHRFVYRCARNPYLTEALERYYALSLRLWYLVLDRLPPLPDRLDEHLELLELLARGAAEEAGSWASAHVRTFERAVRAVL